VEIATNEAKRLAPDDPNRKLIVDSANAAYRSINTVTGTVDTVRGRMTRTSLTPDD
jgi:hypothetical protein